MGLLHWVSPSCHQAPTWTGGSEHPPSWASGASHTAQSSWARNTMACHLQWLKMTLGAQLPGGGTHGARL